MTILDPSPGQPHSSAEARLVNLALSEWQVAPIRIEAARALGEIGEKDPPIATTLTQLALNQKLRHHLRVEAAAALTHFNMSSKAVSTQLLKVAKHSEFVDIAKAGFEALRRLKIPARW